MPTVLIVDDDEDTLEMLGAAFERRGYSVTACDSAMSAVTAAEGHIFDLIISDIGMPKMNGYELVEALRGMTPYRDTPMIAVTGYTEYDERGRSLRAGFNAHLTKPIEPTRLLDLMNELLA